MEKFAIVNLQGGQKKDVESFLLDNDAFPELENAYLFRGRIQRRSGTNPIGTDGRLKGTIGTTDGAGNITLLDGTVPGGIPVGISTFIISGSTLTDPGGISPVTLLTTGATTGSLTRNTGVLATNALTTAVTYIPGLPVMGLCTLETVVINVEGLIAFDTRYSYLYSEGLQEFIFLNTFKTSGTPFVWTGTDSDFFWSTNYFHAFWATNNTPGYHVSETASPVNEGDGIRWYDSEAPTGWVNFNPPINTAADRFLLGGLIILPYKGVLLVLNTLEGPADVTLAVRFGQRARWSQQLGTPFYSLYPLLAGGALATAWNSEVPGLGGFIDAPTQEVIVSAEFIKDTLVVYFERSTWQLVYTGNRTLPFFWQKINTELGSESTFSIVPFDKGVFGVGNYGIITTDSVNVVRIDQNIPDEVFQIQNKNQGTKRVHGIRDYNAQLVYWTYPIIPQNSADAPTYELTYPNQVLVYNYLNGSWSQFDDCFTCFGQWQRNEDITWAKLVKSWNSTGAPWNSQVFQARYPDVIAGNQRGFVLIFSQLQQIGQNSPSLTIANIDPATHTITSPNHNLVSGQYVLITGVQGTTGINGLIYKIIGKPTVTTFQLDGLSDIPPIVWSGTYTGGGYITHMPNFVIMTKEFNPWYEQGKSVKMAQVDMFIEKTTSGQFEADLYVSDDSDLAVSTLVIPTIAETQFQLTQEKIWHRFYTNYFGSFVQMKFTMNEEQMKTLNISIADVTIHGLVLYVDAGGRLAYEF